jgi:hypothetical protein
VRVLCLSMDHPPEGRGGYELQCQGFVEHLRRHGHATRVLTGRELPRFPVVPRASSRVAAGRSELRAAAVLRRHLRDFRPEAVAFWRLGELCMSLVERVRNVRVAAVGMVCDRNTGSSNEVGRAHLEPHPLIAGGREPTELVAMQKVSGSSGSRRTQLTTMSYAASNSAMEAGASPPSATSRAGSEGSRS